MSRRASWGLALLLTGVYLRVLGAERLGWDDPIWLDDPIHGLSPGDALRVAFTEPRDGVYAPVLRVSWYVQAALFGDHLVGMHAVRLILAAACVVGVGWTLRALGLGAAAALATALWATHPARVESVAWLSGLKDVQGLALVLLSTRLALAERARPWWAGLVMAAAVGTKAALFPAPWMVAVAVATTRGPREAWQRCAPAMAVAVGFAATGWLAWDHGDRPLEPPFAGLGWGAWLHGRFVARQLGLVPGPAVVAMPEDGGGGLVLLGVGAALGLAVAAWRWSSARPVVAGWALGLLPFLGWVTMTTWAADRFLLLPSIAACAGLAAWWVQSRAGRWIGVVVVLLGAAASARRVGDWRDDRSLWTAEAHMPGTHGFRDDQLGMALAADGELEAAEAAFARARRVMPEHDVVLSHWIVAALAIGTWDAEAVAVAESLRVPPADAAGWTKIAAALVDHPRPEIAAAALQHALYLGADDLVAHAVAAQLALRRGDEAAFRAHVAAAVQRGAPPDLGERLRARR